MGQFGLIALVAVGGALGSVGRYVVGLAMTRLLGPAFPWGTLTVNVAGSLAMGVVFALVAGRNSLQPELRALLMTGFLGGFTTFSAFSLDLWALAERGETAAALAYGAASVVVSLAALVAGLALVRALAGSP